MDGLHKVPRSLDSNKGNSKCVRETSVDLKLWVVEVLLISALCGREVLGLGALRLTVLQPDQTSVEYACRARNL